MQLKRIKGVALLHIPVAVVCTFILGSLSFPAPELQSEIAQYPEWFPEGSAVTSYSRGAYSVEVAGWTTSEENFEHMVLCFAILIGCAARTLPEEEAVLRMVTDNIIFVISLEGCRLLHQMTVAGASDKVLLKYMGKLTLFEDTSKHATTGGSMWRSLQQPSWALAD